MAAVVGAAVTIDIPVSKDILKGELFLPTGANSLVIFVHGSGSNRFSVRNRFLANSFNSYGFATLLVDLLTEKEKEEDLEKNHLRFNIEFLTERLVTVSKWILANPVTKDHFIAYFSSSTGTAAALNATGQMAIIRTIVSRGGRPDLACSDALRSVDIPLLFIVGEKDKVVIDYTKKAIKEATATRIKQLIIIPGSTHFFEEYGKLEEVARVSREWFMTYLNQNGHQFVTSYGNKKRIDFSRFMNMSLTYKFQDRTRAGNMLARVLQKYHNDQDIVLLALANGGIVVANAISKKLSIDRFGIVFSRRLRSPHDPETAIGALLHDGFVFLNSNSRKVSKEYLIQEISNQKLDLKKKIMSIGISPNVPDTRGKTIILIDDGAHTGSTLLATINWLNQNQAMKKIIIALPVISKETFLLLSKNVNKVEYIYRHRNFTSVENYYNDFRQVTDEEVKQILSKGNFG